MPTEFKHISVLLDESIQALTIKSDGIYIDCTLGGGGHAAAILRQLTTGHLYAFDQDEYAIRIASEKLRLISNNYTIIQANFANLKEQLSIYGITKVDGILYDLGVSSFQFDMPERGFSYRFDGPLDMRMDQTQSLDAFSVVNQYSETELKRILYEYGEEKYAPLIAKNIVKARKEQSISTTLELVQVIKQALPAAILRNASHPAKQTFQALRIEVNHELDILKMAFLDGLSLLKKDGRMVVITFHSLEDRIVKTVFKEKTTLSLPKGIPFIPEGYHIDYALINQKVILPTEEEQKNNPRSHSAKMRVIQRIRD